MEFLKNFKDSISPWWNFVTILVGVAYGAYLVAFWSFQKDSNDIEFKAFMEETREKIAKFEDNQKGFQSSLTNLHIDVNHLTSTVNSIHFILNKKGSHHETIP